LKNIFEKAIKVALAYLLHDFLIWRAEKGGEGLT
jgi:hypothetical protein